MSTLVKKIIFRDNDGLDKLYLGNELIFYTEKKPVELDYLTFEALEPSSIEYLSQKFTTAQYSYDKVNWKNANYATLRLNTGDKVYFKGNITGNQTADVHASFRMTGKIAASGSIMSLQEGNPQDKILKYDYEFIGLFFDCASLVTAPELPATELTNYCYQSLFTGCSIVNAPELPATTLKTYCYAQLFYNCKSLVNAPILPATTLANGCYTLMFEYCESLVNAPELPITTLADSCYSEMFYYCTSLVNAPILPATTLADGCYYGMFKSCKSLVNAPELPATTLYNDCYMYMFSGCTSLKNAPVLPATTLATTCYSHMFDGCTSLIKVPEISAKTLANRCYQYMFINCKNLNYIKCDIREYNSYYFDDWVRNVPSNGDFYCYDSSILPTGNRGIPKGWRIHSEIGYDALYVSGHYEFKIPKGDGTYYVIDTKNDCEADVITDKDFTSINSTIIASNSGGDRYEWELFFNNTNLYFDIGYKFGERLSCEFGEIKKDTVYTIGGSNGNYLGTDMALYVNGSKKASSTTKSTYNNESDTIKIGENVINFYVGNIKIYEYTGLVYNIVPIMYKGKVEFFDKVNRQFMEITSKPSSQYAKTRLTGEKIGI